MEDSLKYYLENTLISKAAIESRLSHPITKVRYPTRLVYILLKKYANDFLNVGLEPRFVSLAGLRGVGKTTLLWQTAHYIYLNHHKEIYFFNVNILKNLGIDLHSALEEFQRHILKKRFNELSEPITLLFDEVHDDENWSKTLKILYDEARSAFILCTGSSALLLNSTADLSRRMHIQKVLPFSFSELLNTHKEMFNKDKLIVPNATLGLRLKEALFFSKNQSEVLEKLTECNEEIEDILTQTDFEISLLQSQYLDFLNFPNLLFFDDEIIIINSILDLLKRIISEDIPKLKPAFTDFTKIEKLMLRLAGSDEINPEKLAGVIGIKQGEINELIDIIAKAELINVLLPFGGLDTKIMKNKKAFFMSPSLRSALLSTLYGKNLPDQFKSKLIEDIVVMYLKRVLTDGIISYSTGNNEANPDFVIETRDKPILLEIGTNKTTIKQLKQSNINARYGLLISNGIKKPTIKDDFILIPINWFLLL